MRISIITSLVFLFILSCNRTEKSPDFVTYKTIPEGTSFQEHEHAWLNKNYTDAMEGKHPGLDSMLILQHTYFQERSEFDISRYRSFWNKFRKEVVNRELTQEEILIWIDLTGFLFQLTADAMVAEELERAEWQHLRRNPELHSDSLVTPYIFTRHTDNVHLNLFAQAEIEFTHSLGGQVKITQITDFPNSDKVIISFGMETKQYIELFIRIPSWAENAVVTVKGVKYLAQPGAYSQIAKKWKEGDEVEVIIPTENLPYYITPGQ